MRLGRIDTTLGLARLLLCLELRVHPLYAFSLMCDLRWVAGHRVDNRRSRTVRVLYVALLLIRRLCEVDEVGASDLRGGVEAARPYADSARFVLLLPDMNLHVA